MREQREHQKRSPAALRERLTGLSTQQHAEDIEFWRKASEHERGMTLYELLALGEAIGSSRPYVREEWQRIVLRPGRIEVQTIE